MHAYEAPRVHKVTRFTSTDAAGTTLCILTNNSISTIRPRLRVRVFRLSSVLLRALLLGQVVVVDVTRGSMMEPVLHDTPYLAPIDAAVTFASPSRRRPPEGGGVHGNLH